MSEIKVVKGKGVGWIKVLPKEFVVSGMDGAESGERVFLAPDKSEGLFVIGAYGGKEEAWLACCRYEEQLAYCCEVEGRKEWVDGEGMLHATGKVGGRGHHWFVAEYAWMRGQTCECMNLVVHGT
jgi:hypothetical protein